MLRQIRMMKTRNPKRKESVPAEGDCLVLLEDIDFMRLVYNNS